MEACANIEEVKAFRGNLDPAQTGRSRSEISQAVARSEHLHRRNGQAARDALRPTVARLLGAARLKFTTAEAQGLTLPAELVELVAGRPMPRALRPICRCCPMSPIAT